MKRNILLLFLIVQLGNGFSQSLDKNQITDVDNYVASMIDSLDIVGLNYAILIDNEVVHENSFGTAHAQLHVPMTLHHSFPVASISKMYTPGSVPASSKTSPQGEMASE